MNVMQSAVLAHGLCDGTDRLVSADELLASLQRSCGGELSGAIAVPELMRLVRDARRAGLPLTRMVNAQDGNDEISAWIEAEPRDEGCAIRVRSWQTSPINADEGFSADRRRIEIDRLVSDMSVWLDGGQRIIAVATRSAELAELAQRMQDRVGRCWTEVLPPAANAYQQPLHWRLVDGAPVTVEGSAREWRVSLVPHLQPGYDPSGFELLLVSDQPSFEKAEEQEPVTPPSRGLIGRELAPVLKQPIARIIANAETIRTRLAGPLLDAYADHAREIAGAGKLLLGLLDDMADLEVVEAEGFSTTPDYIDLAEVAQQAAGILGVRAQEKQIAIEPISPGATAPALAEFRRVLQVLLNLIGNAIRYSPEGSTISLSVESDGRLARVAVSDQGPGLSPEDQGRIFEKFERLGRSGDGGSGLGLYISRQLARAMGGELRVESVSGHGSRFILEVPADPEG